MKLDFLKTLKELAPCGLRPVADTLGESYPTMAYSDWREILVQLTDGGFVMQQGNGQYRLTKDGGEAVKKGKTFDDELGSGVKCNVASLKMTPHTKNDSQSPASTDPAGGASETKLPQTKAITAKPDTTLNGLSKTCIDNLSQKIEKMSTDDLIRECKIAKELITQLSDRFEAAQNEVKVRTRDILSVEFG